MGLFKPDVAQNESFALRVAHLPPISDFAFLFPLSLSFWL